VRQVVVHVVGARPNYMKMAPVYAELAPRELVDQYLIHTGQHYDAKLSDVFFSELPLPEPDVMLEVGSGSHAEQTARALVGLERAFQDLEPDLVVLPGDVNSTVAGALAAVKLQIPACHLEAGLRSFDTTMPEEHNRKVTDHLASLLLAPSPDAVDNLAAEGIRGDRVALVGNTMIDTLCRLEGRFRALRIAEQLELSERGFVLVTLHRPSLVDGSLLPEVLEQLQAVAERIPVVFPVHPRTRQRIRALERYPDIRFLAPVGYLEFLSLEADAAAVLTDSGGVQEETTFLGVPCFTLRATTERPVTTRLGTNVVLGLDPSRISEVVDALGTDERTHSVPPLWDGRASERIADIVVDWLE